MLKEGWLRQQFEEDTRTVDKWPDWMRREAGIGQVCASPSDRPPATRPSGCRTEEASEVGEPPREE